MNYYDILGVPPTASQEEIRRAYRAQVKFFHPDVFRESEEVAKIKTQQLNEAYAILGDPVQRELYDSKLKREEEAKKQSAQSQKRAEETKKQSTQSRKRQYTHVYRTHTVQPKKKGGLDIPRNIQKIIGASISLLASVLIISGAIKNIEFTRPHESLVPVTYGNGQVVVFPSGERLCPLGIDVRGDQAYYVYLDSLDSSVSDMSFMVSPGNSVEVMVPIGEYEVYYATGKTWYGQEYKFGPETQYYQCDQALRFYKDNQYYRGYTLKLYQQSNGNLETDKISAANFPG